MDETDLQLCQLLLINSRVPVRDLADKLNISVQAVHKRVQNLVDNKCIYKYVTLPSEKAWPAMSVHVYGISKTKSMDDALEKLSKNDWVMGVYIGSGNIIYVAGILRNINEVDEFTEFVKKTGEITEPEVGIMPPMTGYGSLIPKPSEPPRELSPLDLRIIGSLHSDSRKSVAEIAKELNVSAKTVNRHIEKMIEDELISFTILWYPKHTGDQVTFLHLTFKSDVEKNVEIAKLMNKYSPRIAFFLPFINIPQRVVAVTWSTSMLDFEQLQKALEGEESIQSTEAHFLYRGGYFDTWRDKKLFSEIAKLDKKR
ncbi:MAG: winged helix-turn-helix transcriptional regulator [Thermoplasmata archaeon]|nr:MAG: winged helix-turn-helix transcriptional regulator [Thermoplasmata archaeon]